MFETPDNTPLLRVAWNKQDPNYVAVIGAESERVIILDVRVPSVAVTELTGHVGPVNSVAWAPHSAHHICSACKCFLNYHFRNQVHSRATINAHFLLLHSSDDYSG